jgi:GNAT superfamily N-acetyltransferase
MGGVTKSGSVFWSTISMDNYKIRLATLNDLHAIRTIEIEAASRFKDTDLFESILDEERNIRTVDLERLAEAIGQQTLWVACLDNNPVAFALCDIFGNKIFLEEIDVMTEHGRRGLASRLIETACKWALNQGLVAMELSTFDNIPWNAPFYKKLGFETLTSNQWTEDLMDVRHNEQKVGLPLEKRVIMRLNLV